MVIIRIGIRNGQIITNDVSRLGSAGWGAGFIRNGLLWATELLRMTDGYNMCVHMLRMMRLRMLLKLLMTVVEVGNVDAMVSAGCGFRGSFIRFVRGLCM